MPTLDNHNSNVEKPCSRCGGKRKMSKTWVEKIENSAGFMTLKHTEYKCLNKECQDAFEKEILAEAEKRDKLKKIKLENAAKRATA